MTTHEAVEKHYNRYPYPKYPYFLSGSWRNLGSVDTSKWGASIPIRDIWIAGCGSVAPLMFGRRNFNCRILASDLSAASLRVARIRLFIHGVHNVQLVKEDLADSAYEAQFDAVDSYGVIHHTEDPQQALARLVRALKPGGVLRLMVYSAKAREHIEKMRRLVQVRGISSVSEAKSFLKDDGQELSGELSNSVGVADAVLHPLVHVYTEKSLRDLIATEKSLQILKLESSGNFVVFARKQP